MTIVKTDAAHFVKDTSTGALLNTDQKGYQAHLERRKRKLQEQEAIDKRLSTLEDNVSEILQLLRGLGK